MTARGEEGHEMDDDEIGELSVGLTKAHGGAKVKYSAVGLK